VGSTTIDANVKMRGGPYGKTAAEWQGRRIYQIVTDRFGGSTQPCNPADEVYCGGTFNGIREHLDYITGMGFNAIWISPVIVNTPGGYHGYWAKDFFAVNPHFGTVGDLQALVAACHSRGVWVMIDVVINHVGPVGDDFSSISPFNSSSHYHTDCAVTQYVCNTEMVWECRLASLPDLNQANPYVMQQLTNYVEWLMDDDDVRVRRHPGGHSYVREAAVLDGAAGRGGRVHCG
jgi:alpha-amylase